mmetsp:Transcript_26911/g.36960  ORF Transcript_26911/g.36960 Transcript_26911/m.36960 type:complete len:1010 (-) Transcript_26911:94-3123(-)
MTERKPEYSSQQLVELEQLVSEGIQKILKLAIQGDGAKSGSYIEAPYGRHPLPTPLISEDQFINHLIEKQKRINARAKTTDEGSGEEKESSVIANDDDLDADPEFKFEYGFDPLQILGEYLQWAHPESKKQRNDLKIQAAASLAYRAKHAIRQIATAKELRYIAGTMGRSGVFWGPFCTMLSSSIALCIAKPLKPHGTMIFQLCAALSPSHSPAESFEDCLLSNIFTVEVDATPPSTAQRHHSSEDINSTTNTTSNDSNMIIIASLEEVMPIKCVFKDLKPGTRYAVRCGYHLSAEPTTASNAAKKSQLSPLFDAVLSQVFEYAEFWTLPADGEASNPNPKVGNAVEGDVTGSGGASVTVFAPVSLLSVGQSSLWSPDTDPFTGMSRVPKNPNPSQESEKEEENNVVKKEGEEVKVSFSNEPTVCCVLGDVFTPLLNNSSTNNATNSNAISNGSYLQWLDKLYRSSGMLGDKHGLLRNCAAYFAWSDRGSDGLATLRLEEEAFKIFKRDLKRFQKKNAASGGAGGSNKQKGRPVGSAPVLRRPPTAVPLQLLHQCCPAPELETFVPAAALVLENPADAAASAVSIANNTKACRMLYRSVMLGPDLQLIVLDVRGCAAPLSPKLGTYLGAEQAAWLFNTLENSPALWKVISVGQAVGLSLGDEKDTNGGEHAPAKSEEEAKGDEMTEKETQAAPAAPAPKTVHMQVPAASREDEVDEFTGLSLHSLQFILSSLHAKVTAKKRRPSIQSSTGTETVANDALGIALEAAVAAANATKPNPKLDKDDLDEQSEAGGIVSDEIYVQLGIVLLSSGDSFDLARRIQHSLPAYVCIYTDFMHNTNTINNISNTDNNRANAHMNILDHWEQKKIELLSESLNMDTNDDNASAELNQNTSNVSSFVAEIAVGSRSSVNNAANYRSLGCMDTSIMFANDTDNMLVACHLRLLADGKLEAKLLGDVSTTYNNANNNTQSDENVSMASAVVGVEMTGKLLYQCRFVTKAQTLPEQDEEDVE